MYRLKLYLTMGSTLALFIGISTLAIIIVARFLGLGLYYALTLAVIFNLLQWIMAPKVIEMIYRLRPIEEYEMPELHRRLEKLSRKLNIKKPKLLLADIDAPNAFAYGGIFGEKRVAVTRGLLRRLNMDEVEAVLGHELGHIVHRDVTFMMFLSLLPTIFYMIWRWAMYSIYFSMYSDRDRGGSTLILAAGAVSFIFYIILNLILLGFSRLREYYADMLSSRIVDNGARNLMRALIKIVSYSSPVRGGEVKSMGFKALLISDPDTSIKAYRVARDEDELIEYYLERRLTLLDKIMELFSTHPNIVKRLRRLRELEEAKWS